MSNIKITEEIPKAEAVSGETMHCEECDERVLFHLKDSQHDFVIGMTTILQCIEFAIKTGDLPKMPYSWVREIEDGYGILFDEDVSFMTWGCNTRYFSCVP